MATPSTSQAKRLALLLLPILLSRADPNAPCYFPSSGPAAYAPGFFPCIPSNVAVGACCPAGWTCFSDALCIATTPSNSFPNLTYGAVKRAACTNPRWDNSACGSFCLDDDTQTGDLIACTPFSHNGLPSATFCCKSDFDAGRCACDPPRNAFTLAAGVVQTIIQVSETYAGGVPSISVATTTARGSLTTWTTTITARGSLTTWTTTITAPVGVAPTPGLSPELWGVEAPAGREENISGRNLTVGLTVGVTLGVVALAGLLLLFLWWRRRRAAAAEAGEAEAVDATGGGGAAAADGSAAARGGYEVPPGEDEHRAGDEHGPPMEERAREDNGEGPVYAHR